MRGTNVALVHLQMVRRIFLTSTLVIKLSWGSEWYVEQEKLATKLPRASVRACLRNHGVGWWKGGDRNQARDGREERNVKEKEGVSRPKFKRRENLARQSAAGRKKVPVRRQVLAFSLCIFDTSPTMCILTIICSLYSQYFQSNIRLCMPLIAFSAMGTAESYQSEVGD